jgi:hypothetical protein
MPAAPRRRIGVRGYPLRARTTNWLKAYLSRRNELKRSKSSLEIRSVSLEVVESTGNASLELRGILAGWARGRDLVEGTHDCGCREKEND